MKGKKELEDSKEREAYKHNEKSSGMEEGARKVFQKSGKEKEAISE